jgi:hypothetical protein
MNTPNDDERLEQSAKAAFDDSVERLDAATLSKLNQGRQAALAEIASASPARQWTRWVPATGMATAALVAVLVFRGPEQTIEPFDSDPIATDFEILIGDDALEMIEELEFYSWIDMADLDSTDNVG